MREKSLPAGGSAKSLGAIKPKMMLGRNSPLLYELCRLVAIALWVRTGCGDGTSGWGQRPHSPVNPLS
ncbi:MAG: hypothetical protein WCA35_24900, partial [Kovacikia sp.]